jgi:hypothetical protein
MNENEDGKIFKGTVRLWTKEFEVTAKNEDDACKKILAKAEGQVYIPKLVSNDWDETEDNWGKKERVHWDDE